MNINSCSHCEGPVLGRSDKKFCSDTCRNKWNWENTHGEKRKQHYIDNKNSYLENRAKYAKEHNIKILLSGAKRRASQKNLPFNITEADVIIPKRCPLLNILIKKKGKRTNSSPSLDRIIPELGYIKGNVWIISWKANRLKSNLSHVELAMFCTSILKKINEVTLK